MGRSAWLRASVGRRLTSFAGLGTAIALGATAMAAATPVPVPGDGPASGAEGAGEPAGRSLAASASASRSLSPSAPAAAPSPAPAPTPAKQPAKVTGGHLGGPGLAVALAAAGRQFPGNLDAAALSAAADSLGVVLDDPVSRQDTKELSTAAWKAADRQWALAGIGPGDAPDPSDVREAAERLGVKIKGDLTPDHVAAVLAAGRRDVAQTMSAAGFRFGSRVDIGELEKAARRLGHKYGKSLDARDAKITVWMARDKVKREWEAEHAAPAFAEVGGVKLRLPSHRVHYAGFHQAAYPVAIPMSRAGEAKTRVLPSRGRGTSRASAIDIVQAPGEDVRSPVTGKVVEVTHYRLYGKYPDVKMRIRPDGASNLLVTVLHVQGDKVKVGDRVKAGMTVIADSPRTFPFSSQVDAFSGQPWGHVHIEVKRR